MSAHTSPTSGGASEPSEDLAAMPTAEPAPPEVPVSATSPAPEPSSAESRSEVSPLADAAGQSSLAPKSGDGGAAAEHSTGAGPAEQAPSAPENARSDRPEAPPPPSGRLSADTMEIEPDVVGPPPLPSRRADPKPLNVISNLPHAGWPPKVIGDLMTRKIITVMEDEAIGDLEGWMQRFRFRHLPVVNARKQLVGLIAHSDLLHAELGVAPDGTPTSKAESTTLAGDIMRRNVVVARVDSPLITACEVMLKEKLACLPVVLEDGTLVGIATMTDFVRLALALLENQSP